MLHASGPSGPDVIVGVALSVRSWFHPPRFAVERFVINPIRTVLACGIGASLVWAAGVVAQPKIVITNPATPLEIPLLETSTVEIDANGNLRAQCKLTGDKCTGVSTSDPAPIGGPTGVTLTSSTATLNAGGQVTLTWNSGAGTEACYGAGPAGISNWTGQVLPASGSRQVTMSVAGDYVFQVRCYNATASTTQTAPSITVNENEVPPSGTNYCTEYYANNMPTHPSFTAFNFAPQVVSFQTVWGVEPGSTAPMRALPGQFANPSALKYVSIPFVMTANGSASDQFGFGAIEAAGLEGVVTGSVSATISPCQGDFRARVAGSSDRYLSHQCRNTTSNMQQFTLTVTSNPSLSGCYLPAGKIFYLNVATYNMYGTSAPTTTTCGTSSTCGVSMRLL
jgi:hypothetical protein